jgi:hypothetical protein
VTEVPEQGKADFGLAGGSLEEIPPELAAGGTQGSAVVAVGQAEALGQAGQVPVVGAGLGRTAGMEVLHLDREGLGRRVAATAGHGRVLRSARRAKR